MVWNAIFHFPLLEDFEDLALAARSPTENGGWEQSQMTLSGLFVEGEWVWIVVAASASNDSTLLQFSHT